MITYNTNGNYFLLGFSLKKEYIKLKCVLSSKHSKLKYFLCSNNIKHNSASSSSSLSIENNTVSHNFKLLLKKNSVRAGTLEVNEAFAK